MAFEITDILKVVFSDVGGEVDGTYNGLTWDGANWALEIPEELIGVYYISIEGLSILGWSIGDPGVEYFSGLVEEQWVTEFDNRIGSGTGVVSIGGPPKATNPTPADAAVNVSKNITTFSWEVEEE